MAQSEPITHILYIFTYGEPKRQEEDRKMLEVLQFINDNISTINEMGIKIQIQKYTGQQILSDKALREKLQKECVRFPSIKTPNRTYTGFEDIQKLYISNIQNFKKFESKHEKPVPEAESSDLEDYMRKAIIKGDDEGDGEDAESLSGGKGLSAQVSAAIAARTQKNPSKPIRGINIPREPDNVKPNKESIQQTISRLNPSRTDTTIRGGGNLGDDDGPVDGDSHKDDEMARKFAEREESSM